MVAGAPCEPIAILMESNQKSLVVIGAGGHSKTVISVAQALQISIRGVLDQSRDENETVLGVPIIGEMSSYLRYIQSNHFLIAIGDNATRMNHFMAIQLKNGNFTTLVHPDAKIDDSASLGLGCVVAQSAIICPNAQLGRNVIVNSRALIEHDCKVESHAHIGPDASLAGKVTVKEGAFIGLRAIVKDGIQIGKWAKVGAGAVVVSDVPDGATVVGNPARIVTIKNLPTQAQAPAPIFISGLSIREALEKMDYYGVGHGIVIRQDRVALGVITDGLIRRYILANGKIDASVDNVMNKDFFFLPHERESEAIYHFSHLIGFIPILNAEKKLLRVIEKSDVMSNSVQTSQDAPQQVKPIFQWLSYRDHQHYSEEHFLELWKSSLDTSPSAYHMSAETLLENILLSFSRVHISEVVKEWWPNLILQNKFPQSKDQLITIQHIDETPHESSGFTLLVGGNLVHQNFKHAYLQRCTPKDQLNLEGAGLLFNFNAAILTLSSRLHPMQMAIGLPQLKKLGMRS
jgi:sugar O-acyltransferase (sialic acid O-acetyltransferase NeuD family)